MSAPLIDDEDDQYASSEDSDFAPDAAPAQDSDASDSEGAAADESDRPSKRRRTAGDAGIADDVGYDNSGDEAIVKKGEKKKRKKDKNRARQDAQDDDEGGEGGLIKTRRQRAAEYATTSFFFSLFSIDPISRGAIANATPGRRSARSQRPPDL